VSDSWEVFAGVLLEECASLSRVNEASLRLTKALVECEAPTIALFERDLDSARKAYLVASGRRRGMQVRGFGAMNLRQVCAYAPRRFAPVLRQRLSELATQSIALGITNRNNKALILSGMDRLIKITGALQ
jgi:hypothetical protein